MLKKQIYIIIYVTLALMCFGSVAQGQRVLGFKIINGAKKAKFPFELYNNLIVVPVILNNQLPLKFVLDTGVRTTILTEKAYSDILNLKYNRKYSISGLGKEKLIEAYVTNDISLALPGVRGNGHAMLVLAEDYLELPNYLGTQVHGIMGYELFSRFIVDINYDSRILTLTTPEYFKPKRSYEAIPITVEDTKPYINGHISYYNGDAIDVKLMIDSGASHGLLLDEDSDDQLFVPEQNISSSLGRGLGGLLEGKISRLSEFSISKGKEWKDVITTFPESSDFLDSLKKSNVYRNGSIGGEILNRFKVIFDFPGEKIYLKKGKQFKHPFVYNLSGLVVKAKGSSLDTYEIAEVRVNSAGERAGFKKGDLILSINNVDAKNLALSHVVGMLNAKENKRLKMKVQRGNEKYSSTFRLKSQI